MRKSGLKSFNQARLALQQQADSPRKIFIGCRLQKEPHVNADVLTELRAALCNQVRPHKVGAPTERAKHLGSLARARIQLHQQISLQRLLSFKKESQAEGQIPVFNLLHLERQGQVEEQPQSSRRASRKSETWIFLWSSTLRFAYYASSRTTPSLKSFDITRIFLATKGAETLATTCSSNSCSPRGSLEIPQAQRKNEALRLPDQAFSDNAGQRIKKSHHVDENLFCPNLGLTRPAQTHQCD